MSWGEGGSKFVQELHAGVCMSLGRAGRKGEERV